MTKKSQLEVNHRLLFFVVMTTANLSADEMQNTVAQLYSSTYLTPEIHGQLTFISVFNIFLSITAFFGNALILVALYKQSSLHSPSKVLLSNLAATDLCDGLIIEPLTVIYLMSVVNEHWNICRYLAVTCSVISRYSVRSVSVHTDCNKRGQTSRSVVGTEVQASCNCEPHLCDRCYVLACVHFSDGNVFLESCSNLLVHDRSFTSFSSNLDLLLHKDFLQPLPSSKSSK